MKVIQYLKLGLSTVVFLSQVLTNSSVASAAGPGDAGGGGDTLRTRVLIGFQEAVVAMKFVTAAQARDLAENTRAIYVENRTTWINEFATAKIVFVETPLEDDGVTKAAKVDLAADTIYVNLPYLRQFKPSPEDAFVLAVHETGHLATKILGGDSHSSFEEIGRFLLQNSPRSLRPRAVKAPVAQYLRVLCNTLMKVKMLEDGKIYDVEQENIGLQVKWNVLGSTFALRVYSPHPDKPYSEPLVEQVIETSAPVSGNFDLLRVSVETKSTWAMINGKFKTISSQSEYFDQIFPDGIIDSFLSVNGQKGEAFTERIVRKISDSQAINVTNRVLLPKNAKDKLQTQSYVDSCTITDASEDWQDAIENLEARRWIETFSGWVRKITDLERSLYVCDKTMSENLCEPMRRALKDADRNARDYWKSMVKFVNRPPRPVNSSSGGSWDDWTKLPTGKVDAETQARLDWELARLQAQGHCHH